MRAPGNFRAALDIRRVATPVPLPCRTATPPHSSCATRTGHQHCAPGDAAPRPASDCARSAAPSPDAIGPAWRSHDATPPRRARTGRDTPRAAQRSPKSTSSRYDSKLSSSSPTLRKTSARNRTAVHGADGCVARAVERRPSARAAARAPRGPAAARQIERAVDQAVRRASRILPVANQRARRAVSFSR